VFGLSAALRRQNNVASTFRESKNYNRAKLLLRRAQTSSAADKKVEQAKEKSNAAASAEKQWLIPRRPPTTCQQRVRNHCAVQCKALLGSVQLPQQVHELRRLELQIIERS